MSAEETRVVPQRGAVRGSTNLKIKKRKRKTKEREEGGERRRGSNQIGVEGYRSQKSVLVRVSASSRKSSSVFFIILNAMKVRCAQPQGPAAAVKRKPPCERCGSWEEERAAPTGCTDPDKQGAPRRAASGVTFQSKAPPCIFNRFFPFFHCNLLRSKELFAPCLTNNPGEKNIL